MIHEMLVNPAMRLGPTPPFDPHDQSLENGLRLKRVRQWAGHGEAAKLLPWLALNPSGFNGSGKGLSGSTMARLAYLWGFDGVATYNVLPFGGSNPKRDIWPLLRKGGLSLVEEIQNNHAQIAVDLSNNDDLVVGWGSQGGQFGGQVNLLAKHLILIIDSNPSRSVPVRLWHVGLNEDGTPKHAGARGKYRIAKDAMPLRFSFID